jgi:hypothetical protein
MIEGGNEARLITCIFLVIYCHDGGSGTGFRRQAEGICVEIRNETSLADIVSDNCVWLYQPPGSGHSYAI